MTVKEIIRLAQLRNKALELVEAKIMSLTTDQLEALIEDMEGTR